MAAKSPLLRLDDIRAAISGIEEDVGGATLADFRASRQLRWAVERGIEIISEASRRIPDDLKAQYADIPWPKVAGIGNVLRHEYMEVAPDIIWAVVQNELPTLKRAVDAMISALENARSERK